MSKRDKPLALAAETLCIFAMYCTTWPDTGMPGACCRLYRYWLLGTSVQEKTDLACPITIIPGHGTRLRDKANLFFSLSERGKLHQARTTDTFWQHALRK